MHLRTSLLFLFVINFLYCSNNDRQLSRNNSFNDNNEQVIQHNNEQEIPAEERYIELIRNCERVIGDRNSSEQVRIEAQLELIVYYYWQRRPAYDRIKEICENILSYEGIYHQHAPFFLGELFFKGYGVESNFDTALQYYQQVLEEAEEFGVSLLGPSNYFTISKCRIRQINRDRGIHGVIPGNLE
ncbi:MAG: SEL1-like repeat protein [Candidatus Babeliales bacterium]|nr:SEL1-like repeat protein [Candidatus Babeliales bacterium]